MSSPNRAVTRSEFVRAHTERRGAGCDIGGLDAPAAHRWLVEDGLPEILEVDSVALDRPLR